MKHRTAILTISDRGSRGERQDLSGPALRERLGRTVDFKVVAEKMVSDDPEEVKDALIEWCDSKEITLILTTGGTGFFSSRPGSGGYHGSHRASRPWFCRGNALRKS